MLKDYRTYIAALAGFIYFELTKRGIIAFDQQGIESLIAGVITGAVIVFRYLATRKQKTIK